MSILNSVSINLFSFLIPGVFLKGRLLCVVYSKVFSCLIQIETELSKSCKEIEESDLNTRWIISHLWIGLKHKYCAILMYICGEVCLWCGWKVIYALMLVVNRLLYCSIWFTMGRTLKCLEMSTLSMKSLNTLKLSMVIQSVQ